MTGSQNISIRSLALALCCVIGSVTLLGQQDAQYTQFMNFKLGYNPAFAGAEETSVVQLHARQQWLGFEGGPSSQIVAYNTPFSASGSGLGLKISRLSLGLENHFNGEASYAYRIQLRRGARLGIGLSASVRQFSVDFQNATPVQGGGIDQAIPPGQESKVVPNFGAGIYFDSPGFYLGISAPRLLENNLEFTDDETIISREARHFYAMTGFTFSLSDQLTLQPQALFKLVQAAPFDADFNLTAGLGRNVKIGASYRLGGSTVNGFGESISGLASFFAGKHLEIGMTYDVGLGDLGNQHNGSFEAMIRYLIGGRSTPISIEDPRAQ
ncbi:MAG: type IX secretion system membrane protein PorP/SprF [Bacteroidota bacterium]